MFTAPVRYTPDVEQVEDDEIETQSKLIETLSLITETTYRDYGHAFRSVHAKSHALLEGEITVQDDLPPELTQGIFIPGARYPVMLRISSNAGDPLPDAISLQRGMAIKAIGVDGERLPGSEGATTQDFVLANGVAFPVPGPKGLLANLKLLAATTDQVEGLKKVVSAVARTVEEGLEAIGAESALLTQMGGHPNTHPLGESFFSQVPIRYGEYMAKIGVVPLSANLKALDGVEIDIDGRANALRQEIGDFLADQPVMWELRVQLCRDLEQNPIEDASSAWPEDNNPYIAVATIDVAAQSAWNLERARRLDDETAFSPWHGIDAHRPLGALMRARKPAYDASAALRGRLNGCPIREPSEGVALPA